jgi:class 3 adenylate cyclase/tetratricopeptide (TPR) repeat protein
VDIAAWLRELALERYEQAFRENEIDAEILPKLTADDLKDIGVTIVGHRRKLLEAISALAEPALAPQAEQSAPGEAAPKERPAEAERRQLTVLFCDLVGSTELSAKLDPEDMGRVIRAYQDCCAEVVARWDGHVAKYMGDGVLAYFGWPQAHEDDAERSVRAGLDLVQRVERLTATDGAQLGARVGIATGLVMVGDLIGEGAAQEEAVVGETPNRAARIQAVAPPGSVVIDLGCQQLVGGLFEYTDLGAQELKGFAGPVQVWRVLGESRAESRFEAMHGQQLTALVGREHEIGLLADRWERAKEGEGQVVLLSGEPGIGKSRIVRALRERLAGEPHTPLSHYCSPYHTNSALYPVIGLLERAAGFTRDDRADARLDKLEALLARGTEALGEAVPLVAALLGLETGQRYPAPALSPQRQKQRTLEVLVDQVEGLTARQPVLVVYEDVHWVDPTSLEALDLLIEWVQRLPVLVLITFRPEFSPPWTGHAHVMQLSLSRLTRRHGQALVEAVTAGKALPHEVLDQILAKTDGVPLFVEELTKTVLESGLLTDAGDHYTLAGPLAPLAIPATLQDSLMARLDRLAPVKEVAQIGAVIGREFARELVAAVSPLPEYQLSQALDQLVQSELVFRRGTPPEATFSFKHALVQDAAYQSLLKSRRQQLHARVAEAIEAGHAGEGRAPPEILAHHLTEAGLLARALPAWLAAGEQAWRRSAYREAIVHVRRGLEVAFNVPGPEGERAGTRLHNLLGAALLAAHGPRPEVIESYEEAGRLAAKAGETAELLRALWGSWFWNYVRADIASAGLIASDLLGRAGGTSDDGLALQAHHAAWTTGWLAGDLRGAREHAEAGLRLYDETRHHELTAYYGGHDAGVCCRNTLGLTLWLSGSPDRAAARVEEGLALARRLAHPFTLAITLAFASWVRLLRGDRKEAQRLSRELIELCAEQGIPVYLASGRIVKGSLRAADDEDAVEVILANIRALEGLGANIRRSFHLGLLAEVHLRAGRPREGLAALEEAQRFVAEKGERWYEPELHRLQGELTLAAGGARDEARLAFEASRAVAGERGARSFELRAATSLARLWVEQGERQKAHDVLAPVYGWFTEGFDTADLKDAKALLDELG